MYNRYVKIFFCSLYTTTRLAMPKCLFDLPLWEYIPIWEHSGCTWRKCTNALEGVGMHIPFAFQYTIYSVKCTHAHEGGSRDAQCALHMLSAFQALFVRSGESETRTDFAELLLCHTKTDWLTDWRSALYLNILSDMALQSAVPSFRLWVTPALVSR